VRPDNTFEIRLDNEIVRSGNLLLDFSPPVNPPKMIDDVNDKKPNNWVDKQTIPDPLATKPADWDEDAPFEIPDLNSVKPAAWLENEPDYIPSPDAFKPADWDEAEDGKWEAPLIANPKCSVGCGKWKPRMIKNPNFKGKWKAPVIANPVYKGEWKPRQIENINYFEDQHPHNFSKIGAIGFELWTMTDSIAFDNILITQNIAVAEDYARNTWAPKYQREKPFQDEENKIQDEAKRRKNVKDNDYLSQLNQFVEFVLDEINTNPMRYASIVLGFIPVFFILCCRGHNPPKAKSKKSDDKKEDKTKKEEKQDDNSGAKTDDKSNKRKLKKIE